MGAREPLSPPDPAFGELAAAAAAAGVRAWVVGGYVRDRLLGRRREGAELDIVVEDGGGLRLAEEFARRVGAAAPVTFERFGTAQVVFGDRNIEFASARAESYLPDSRKPAVRPASIEQDLGRRDFTINTLLMDFAGQVQDRLGTGLADLEARLLRTPIDPLLTFSDDPLRMLRAIRFSAELGFDLDPALLPAMRRLKERLRPPVVSVERIRDELRRMLVSDRPQEALELLEEAGLLAEILPELDACKGVVQGGFHRWDVFGHTIRAVAATPPDPVTRLAALLHDVGKPGTAALDGSFTGHEKVGAELAQAALSRLRFPNAVAEQVARLVRLHLRPVYYSPTWTDGAVRRLARDAGSDLGRLLDLGRADVAASAYDHPEKLEELAGRLQAVGEEAPSRLRAPISGGDIMAARGIEPGPEVGRLKTILDHLVLDGVVEPTREAVLAHLRAHPEI